MPLRPVQHLHAVSRDYPGVWRQYDRFLAQRRELGDWPGWCYCPMAAAYAIVSGGGDNRVPLARSLEISRVAALAAWRPTQGVYRFDETVMQSLLSTPITGDLPVEHLHRLPEWCCYVELPPERAHGFFAHLEHDPEAERTELRFLLDHDDGLMPLALHLDGGTIDGALAGFVAHANAQAAESKLPLPAYGSNAIREIAGVAGPLVSVLLYLCSGDPEVRSTRGGQPRGLPRMRRGRDGCPYMPEARRPEVYETAFELGAAIRDAERGPDRGGSVRGHLRRAHWHSYWVGSGEQKQRELRWLHPIAVNAGPDRATVRHVADES